jgi:hypothetical protein
MENGEWRMKSGELAPKQARNPGRVGGAGRVKVHGTEQVNRGGGGERARVHGTEQVNRGGGGERARVHGTEQVTGYW